MLEARIKHLVSPPVDLHAEGFWHTWSVKVRRAGSMTVCTGSSTGGCKHRSRGCAAAWTFEMIMVSRAHAQERQGSTNIPFFWVSTIVSAFAKELGALNEARFSAHASSSEKRHWTRTVGRFSIPESLAPPHVRARPRGTVAKSPFYSKKVVGRGMSSWFASARRTAFRCSWCISFVCSSPLVGSVRPFPLRQGATWTG